MGMQREFIEVSPTGVPANPFAAGAAILWLPFFLLAHLLLLATAGFGGHLGPAASAASTTSRSRWRRSPTPWRGSR